MGFRIDTGPDGIVIWLSGWDRAACWRRSVQIGRNVITAARVETRKSLERRIDHRLTGTGTHFGATNPGRRRVGTMLGRDVDGRQWWAVERGPTTEMLLVLDLDGHEFARAVLQLADPTTVAADLS
jgi:hypothetical protein